MPIEPLAPRRMLRRGDDITSYKLGASVEYGLSEQSRSSTIIGSMSLSRSKIPCT